MRATALWAAILIGTAAACTPSTAPPASGSSAASGARAATPDPGSQNGTITGPLQFPSEGIPPLAVYAISTDDKTFYVVETVQNQQHYTMLGVPPGDYYVYATTRPVQSTEASAPRVQSPLRFGGGYTKAVPCGLSITCTDHSMIDVHVSAGSTVVNVGPVDWYVGPDFYPAIPGGGPRRLDLKGQADNYAFPQEAADYYGQLRTGGMLIKGSSRDCPINLACVWYSGSGLGDDATYFPGTAGSNQDLLACAVYTYRDVGTGHWHYLDIRCRQDPVPYPAVNSTGHLALGIGETGCINVHTIPLLAARVVACLASGTQVAIDDGPRYLEVASPSSAPDIQTEYWWHIAGLGWVVHRYVGY
jgi:hypothetical protein